MSSKKKQRVVGFGPSSTEIHLPGGYNWVGPGTEIFDRISLNYKGKVGTSTYWLPRNELDLAAFKHDLAYYSIDNIDRIKADYELLQGKHPSLTVDFLISLQLFARNIQEGFSARKEWASTWDALKSTALALNLLITIAPIKGKGSIGGFLLNPKTGRLPKSVKDFAKKYLGVTGTRVGRRKKDFIRNTMVRLGLIFSGAAYNNLHSMATTIVHKTDLAMDTTHEKEVEKVYNKYLDYLKTIGEFQEDGEFVLTKKGDSEKYKEFFDSFEKYIDVVNRNIEKKSLRYDKPVLNMRNLPLSGPSFIEPPVSPIAEKVKSREAQSNVVDLGRISRPRPAPVPRAEVQSVLAGQETPLGKLWDKLI